MGLISGVITGVTAGAIGFIGAIAFIAGFRFAAFLAGFFFFAAFLEDFFLEDFLEDFFFAAFFFDAFFFATRFFAFFADFFLAFLAVFFFAAFFFAAMVNSFSMLDRSLSCALPPHYQAFDSHRTTLVRRFYAQCTEMPQVKGEYLVRLATDWYRGDTKTIYSARFIVRSSANSDSTLSRARISSARPASTSTSHGRGREL